MSIPGFKPRKGCRVCRINEPAPPGHSCRLKQKKEKGAVRRCRIQSESLLLDRRHRRVRPSSPCSDCPLRFLASNKSEFPNTAQISRCTKARRSEGSEPAPRVKQRVQNEDCRALRPVYPRKCRPAEMENPAKRRPRGRVCCLGCVKMSQCVPPRDAFTHQY